MTTIDTAKIKEAVRCSFLKICCNLDKDVYEKLKCARPSCALEQFAVSTLIENADIAAATNSPVCQDTGMAVVFLDIGQDVMLTGDYIERAVCDGVSAAYKVFRKSVVTPLARANTLDNTPAVIHTRIVPGNTVTVSCMAKGFGSENMSKIYMLTPADGIEGVKDKIIETVKTAGGCPCPPVIVGVGIGGTMEKAATLSKHALLRNINTANPDGFLDSLENELLEKINALGIGAEGLGGNITALKVLIETYPTHIAGLPLAVTMQCHCSRHESVVIGECND